MATFRVWSGAAGANNGSSWSDAYTTFGAAVTAATTSGDIILVHKTHQEQLAADTTYALAANISVVSVNKDASDAAEVMGTGGWIGNSTTNRAISFTGNDRELYCYGITFRLSGATTDNLTLSNSTGFSGIYESCYFWQGITNSGALLNLCGSGLAHSELINCIFRFGNTLQGISTTGSVTLTGCSISSAGSIPTTLFRTNTSMGSGVMTCRGCDFSLITGTLVPDFGYPYNFILDRCKIGAGVAPYSAQTSNPTPASASLLLLDCSSGDTHGLFANYNANGSTILESSIHCTEAPAAGLSWKVVTTNLTTNLNPYKTPLIDLYNDTLSAVTPRLEILRDGSTTAYNNDEIWAEVTVKDASGFTLASFKNDRPLPNATPSAQSSGAGLASWSGESASAWSGKIDSGSSVTPAEVGSLAMRACIGVASATIYIDPVIRTS